MIGKGKVRALRSPQEGLQEGRLAEAPCVEMAETRDEAVDDRGGSMGGGRWGRAGWVGYGGFGVRWVPVGGAGPGGVGVWW